jgi:hypothetical protein
LTVGLKEVLFFAGGVAVGLYVAKLYARSQVNGAIHEGLDAIGLGGGYIESIAQGLVTPAVVG